MAGNILHRCVLSFCVSAIKSRLTGIFSPIKRVCLPPPPGSGWHGFTQDVCISQTLVQTKNTFVKKGERDTQKVGRGGNITFNRNIHINQLCDILLTHNQFVEYFVNCSCDGKIMEDG